MVQTDECVDVISRMNEELDTVQARCQEAEALLCKIKALLLDTTPHDKLIRARHANCELRNSIVRCGVHPGFTLHHLAEVSVQACVRNNDFLMWCSINKLAVQDWLNSSS